MYYPVIFLIERTHRSRRSKIRHGFLIYASAIAPDWLRSTLLSSCSRISRMAWHVRERTQTDVNFPQSPWFSWAFR